MKTEKTETSEHVAAIQVNNKKKRQTFELVFSFIFNCEVFDQFPK